MDETALQQYLDAVKHARSDNQIFAALMMIAKVTKGDACDPSMKRTILEAVNPKFFSRLLRTKKVPEGCSETVFKSVALSVLSALCTDTGQDPPPALINNIPSYLEIILSNPKDEEEEKIQLVDDAFQCLSCLCETEEGRENLLKAQSCSPLSQAIITPIYGSDKALDVLVALLTSCGPSAWEGCESAFHSLIIAMAKDFSKDQSAKKFEICKMLVILFTTMPKNAVTSDDPPWFQFVVAGLQEIMMSRIDSSLREPALKLSSLVIDMCGVDSLLPPRQKDEKLFLLIAHLSCAEVRMVLEDDMDKAFTKGRLLSACYGVLENILNYLTSGHKLQLDSRKVLQLHSAMIGAWSSVIVFLNRVAQDNRIQWDSVVLATMRVLAAWLAEETTALREEVYELLPFILEIGRLSLPSPDNPLYLSKAPELPAIEPAGTDERQAAEDGRQLTQVDEKSHDSPADGSPDTQTDGKIQDSENIEAVSSELQEKASLCDKQSCDNKADSTTDTVDPGCHGDQVMSDCDKINVQSSDLTRDQSANGHVTDNQSDSSKGDHVTHPDQSVAKTEHDSDRESEALQAAIKMTAMDLKDLHRRVDIFRFLLPGLCHLTAEDKPRGLLIEQGVLEVFESYLTKQWTDFKEDTHNKETQSSIVILSNIYLNLTVVESQLVKEKDTFCSVLKLIVQGIQDVECELEHLAVWAHFGCLGLMLIRLVHFKAENFMEPQEIDRFFVSVLRFLSGAYVARGKNRVPVSLCVSNIYQKLWNQMGQTWFLSMQALSECVPLLERLPDIVVRSGWIPMLNKLLLDVQGRGVEEETRSCVMLFLTTVSRNSETLRTLVRERGGLDIAKIYKSQDLQEALKKS